MTEQEWLACTEPDDLLEFLRELGGDRQFRLFVCACCRRFLPLMPTTPAHDLRYCEKAVDYGERFADGLVTWEELDAAFDEMEFVNMSHEGVLAGYAVRNAICVEIAGCTRPLRRGRNLIAHPASEASEFSRTVIGRLAAESTTAKGKSPTSRKRVATIAEKRYQVEILRDIFGNPFQPIPPTEGKKSWTKQWQQLLAWNDGWVLKLAQSIYDERGFERLPILADALEEAGCNQAAILTHCRGEGPHIRGCWVVDLVFGKNNG